MIGTKRDHSFEFYLAQVINRIRMRTSSVRKSALIFQTCRASQSAAALLWCTKWAPRQRPPRVSTQSSCGRHDLLDLLSRILTPLTDGKREKIHFQLVKRAQHCVAMISLRRQSSTRSTAPQSTTRAVFARAVDVDVTITNTYSGGSTRWLNSSRALALPLAFPATRISPAGFLLLCHNHLLRCGEH